MLSRFSIISKSIYSHGMGHWSWVAMTSKENYKITIITVYKICNFNVESVGVERAISQQWSMIQNDEHNKTVKLLSSLAILHLIKFIQPITSPSHQIIIGIYANE